LEKKNSKTIHSSWRPNVWNIVIWIRNIFCIILCNIIVTYYCLLNILGLMIKWCNCYVIGIWNDTHAHRCPPSTMFIIIIIIIIVITMIKKSLVEIKNKTCFSIRHGFPFTYNCNGTTHYNNYYKRYYL